MHPIGVHVGPGLTDDNELDGGGPLARAAEMDADGVQIFLTDPQSYATPKPRPDAEALRSSDVLVVVHALHTPCLAGPLMTPVHARLNAGQADPPSRCRRRWTPPRCASRAD